MIIQNAAIKAAEIVDIQLNDIDKLEFIRMVSNLSKVFGGDDELMIHWLNTYNKHLGFIPSSFLSDKDCLDDINNYLEYFIER